jgi:hypothetical protein
MFHCEDFKLAIEYNGLYWHSEYTGQKQRSYHQMKHVLCAKKGIQLLTIFESDDLHKIFNLIRHKIAQDQKRIYARSTEVRQISNDVATKFHDNFHINGAVKSRYHYGLYHANELVQVASFSKSRFNKKYEYECTRNTIGEIQIVGGTSKLFKHFMRTVNPKSLLTYSDLRFGEGNVYSHCGLKRLENTKPNYWYFHRQNTKIVHNRVKFQKHKLKKLFTTDNFNPDISEWQNMIVNNYDRIFDCGNAVWVWNEPTEN